MIAIYVSRNIFTFLVAATKFLTIFVVIADIKINATIRAMAHISWILQCQIGFSYDRIMLSDIISSLYGRFKAYSREIIKPKFMVIPLSDNVPMCNIGTFWRYELFIRMCMVLVPVVIALDCAAECLKQCEGKLLFYTMLSASLVSRIYAPVARIFPYVRNERCTMRMC